MTGPTITVSGGHFAAPVVFGDVTGTVSSQAVPAGRVEGQASMASPGGIAMHVAVDLVAYRQRSTEGQRMLQQRLRQGLDIMLQSCSVPHSGVLEQETGDGVNIILPSSMDVRESTQVLVRSLLEAVRCGNSKYRDYMSVRMALDLGPSACAALGFDGRTIIRVTELLNCAPLRAVVGSDVSVALGLSATVHQFVVQEGFLPLFASILEPHVITDKNGDEAQVWVAALR